MAAKGKRLILALQFKGKTLPKSEDIKNSLSRVDLIVKYKSFYEEKDTYSSEDEKFNQ
ncbi:MAG: hypothetical protein PHP23_11795 [Desulfobacterales bacterium]|nr:hypothetical protein [Desulfobacterales bacterium]MDD4073082.1 hypothetical protein [Desulfobacterales bacterium]MDD4428903.1 hypothetical protein [Paludibacter sp.]